MPVKPIFNPNRLYFVTTSVVNHIQLFKREDFIRIILDSFHYLRTIKGIQIFIFVVMPNHVHFIAWFSEKFALADVMRDFKRHTARQMIRQLQAENNQKILGLLKDASNNKNQEFKVWEGGYDARDIFSVEFLEQKMNYIHYNPCQPQWKLVDSPEEYLWSSARFYLTDMPAIIAIDDVRDLF
jgi:REP element-mobilizing transposase RayT